MSQRLHLTKHWGNYLLMDTQTEESLFRFRIPSGIHLACQTLTGLTLEHLPRSGSLGRVRRFRKGTDIWRPEDRADRIYRFQEKESS